MDQLTKTEISALYEALDDEYRAWATYDQVIADFGEMIPFTNIRAAKERHIDSLHSLFARYGLPVLENNWPGRVKRYSSVEHACKAGVVAEGANAKMYDRLLKATQREDILMVLLHLQEESQHQHLPEFLLGSRRHSLQQHS